jgi:hypothetical protein
MEGTDLNWRKSSYSGNGGGECVEVSQADRIFVRDTQDRTGPVLTFSANAWKRFADQVKHSLATGSSRRQQGPFPCLMTGDGSLPFIRTGDRISRFMRISSPDRYGVVCAASTVRFHGHWHGGSFRYFKKAKIGVRENLEPGLISGAGCSEWSLSAFPGQSPLLPVYSQYRAVVFPTSPSYLVEVVRSEHEGDAARARQCRQQGRRGRNAPRLYARALRCTRAARSLFKAGH